MIFQIRRFPVTEEEFVRQWLDPVVGKEMRVVGFENPELFGSLFIADNKKLMTWLKDSLPLVDNYPKRLSGYLNKNEKDYQAYREFVADPKNGDNFRNSKDMGMIWPRSLADKAIRYFPISQEISTTIPITSFAFIRMLHKYITEPTSVNYNVYSILKSDAYAKNITQKFLIDLQQTPSEWLNSILRLIRQAEKQDDTNSVKDLVLDSWHIAVGEIIDKEYSLAEKYFEILGEYVGKREKRKLYYLRMYLLSVDGQEQKANSVKQEYMQLVNSGKFKKDEYIENYLKWLEENMSEFKNEAAADH